MLTLTVFGRETVVVTTVDRVAIDTDATDLVGNCVLSSAVYIVGDTTVVVNDVDCVVNGRLNCVVMTSVVDNLVAVVGLVVDRAAVNGAAVDGVVVDGMDIDEADVDGAAVDAAAVGGADVDGIADEAAVDRADVDAATVVGAAVDGMAVDGMTDDGAAVDGAAVDGTADDVGPETQKTLEIKRIQYLYSINITATVAMAPFLHLSVAVEFGCAPA